jgi:hypothetical protein
MQQDVSIARLVGSVATSQAADHYGLVTWGSAAASRCAARRTHAKKCLEFASLACIIRNYPGNPPTADMVFYGILREVHFSPVVMMSQC